MFQVYELFLSNEHVQKYNPMGQVFSVLWGEAEGERERGRVGGGAWEGGREREREGGREGRGGEYEGDGGVSKSLGNSKTLRYVADTEGEREIEGERKRDRGWREGWRDVGMEGERESQLTPYAML